MPLDHSVEEKIKKNVWLSFYPVNPRHELLRALEMFGVPQKVIADVLGISNQSVNYYLTGQRPLPAKYTMSLIAILLSCRAHAEQVLVVMDQFETADVLPPTARRASKVERARLKAAIFWAGHLTGKYWGRVV